MYHDSKRAAGDSPVSAERETTVRIRCNQNRLFGCGRLGTYPATTYTIGVDRRRIQGGGRCECGLPLAVVRDARETR